MTLLHGWWPMADAVDVAQDLNDLHLRHSLAAARQPVVIGAPGECQKCGDDMPRLVGGLCGFCRDGRRR